MFIGCVSLPAKGLAGKRKIVQAKLTVVFCSVSDLFSDLSDVANEMSAGN